MGLMVPWGPWGSRGLLAGPSDVSEVSSGGPGGLWQAAWGGLGRSLGGLWDPCGVLGAPWKSFGGPQDSSWNLGVSSFENAPFRYRNHIFRSSATAAPIPGLRAWVPEVE